jgi:hypothetical protein
MNASVALNDSWNEEKVPVLNGVVFPDGRFVPMTFEDGCLIAQGESSWNPDELNDQWTYATELCRVSIPSMFLDVVAGEGGLGTDGVVIALDTRNNKVQWVLFMNNSNPFDQVKFVGDNIVLTSTLGHVWTIEKGNPANTHVTRHAE